MFSIHIIIIRKENFTNYYNNTITYKENFTNYYDNTITCYSYEQDYVQSPLDQFEIRNLLSLDAPILVNLHIALTNIRLYLTISAAIALFVNFLATNYNKVISNR